MKRADRDDKKVHKAMRRICRDAGGGELTSYVCVVMNDDGLMKPFWFATNTDLVNAVMCLLAHLKDMPTNDCCTSCAKAPGAALNAAETLIESMHGATGEMLQ